MLDRFKRPTPQDISCDIVVIGAGPAGITGAKILKENGLDVWLLGSTYESQLAKAGPIMDSQRLPPGTIGLDYMEEMVKGATDSGVNHKTSNCTGIEMTTPFTVKTKHQNFRCSKILIATGCKQVPLNFQGESDLLHKGISDCAVCDWGLFRGRNVAVVGNHEYTLRAAKFLVDHTPEVHLLWYQKEAVIEEEGITFYSNVTNLVASGGETLENISFKSNDQEFKIEVHGLFVEGKPQPAVKYLENSEIQLEENFVVVDDNFQTSVKGIWAVGDVTGRTTTYDDAVSEAEQAARIILG
jgi:thioredoxin reductase (NADPH)